MDQLSTLVIDGLADQELVACCCSLPLPGIMRQNCSACHLPRKRSKFKIQSMVSERNAYYFHTITKLKDPNLNHRGLSTLSIRPLVLGLQGFRY